MKLCQSWAALVVLQYNNAGKWHTDSSLINIHFYLYIHVAILVCCLFNFFSNIVRKECVYAKCYELEMKYECCMHVMKVQSQCSYCSNKTEKKFGYFSVVCLSIHNRKTRLHSCNQNFLWWEWKQLVTLLKMSRTNIKRRISMKNNFIMSHKNKIISKIILLDCHTINSFWLGHTGINFYSSISKYFLKRSHWYELIFLYQHFFLTLY
jgi:hypothetical protein